MATDNASPSLENDQNPILEYVDDHPFISGFLVFELALLLIAVLLNRPADIPTSIVQDSNLLNVLAGLLGAFALMLGIIGILLILGLSLWSFLESGQ